MSKIKDEAGRRGAAAAQESVFMTETEDVSLASDVSFKCPQTLCSLMAAPSLHTSHDPFTTITTSRPHFEWEVRNLCTCTKIGCRTYQQHKKTFGEVSTSLSRNQDNPHTRGGTTSFLMDDTKSLCRSPTHIERHLASASLASLSLTHTHNDMQVYAAIFV